jgi:hypothetical protein
VSDSAELLQTVERVRVFVDYWNLQLTANERLGRDFTPDWRRIPRWLGVDAVRLSIGDASLPLRLDGLNVYASYNPASAADRRFKGWATNFLDRVPGVRVLCKARKPRYAPRCQACHRPIDVSPHCSASVAGTVEKGVDVAIATDMIRLAWEESYDYAVLVSSDADFAPAVEFLISKGRRVIHVGFPPKGMGLAKTCWASLNMAPFLASLERSVPGRPTSTST